MFAVFLGARVVGQIIREEGTGILTFSLDDGYADTPARPVLGQQFEDRRRIRVWRQTGHPGQLPTFFANLLPEGALDAMIQAQFAPKDALDTLAAVGEDLPGAVIVRPALDLSLSAQGLQTFDEPPAPVDPNDDRLRFSLAGIQTKFSAVQSGDRFTLPFRGAGGRWILKFSTERFPNLPENEYATMQWAKAVGLNVPECRLIAPTHVEGLDPRFASLGSSVYVIERYDRTTDGKRIHQEDLAQVRGVLPDRKYTGWSLEGIARFIGDVCGRDDQLEYIRRMLFVLLSGNTDAHLKNWSLIYPDGRTARLAPAYDFVCVREYWADAELALPIANDKIPERIGWDHLAHVDQYLRRYGATIDTLREARDFIPRILDTWASHRQTVPESYRQAVDSHLSRLALTREI